jgi:salicylate hydroxylase
MFNLSYHSTNTMSSAPKPINVAIIGGGFGGLCLLIGLQKYPHINAHVYEAAHKFSEVGAGVVIGPNAQRAMSLIDPRILEGYNRRAGMAEDAPDENGLYPWITVAKGQMPDVDEMVIQYKNEQRGSTIHRAHFLDELVKLVEPHRAHFGKRVIKIIESGGSDPIVLQFDDGTSAETDIVIGADGIHSMVRKYILGPEHPAASALFTGLVIYRAIVPIEVAKAKLGEIKQSTASRCGKDGLVFAFPLANFTRYYLGVSVFNSGPWKHDKWIIPADVTDVKAKFADWDDYVRKQVELLPNDGSTMGWSVWEMPPAPTYFKGRVAMMGDAAHGSTPIQGAGAGQAIEDALVLERLLGGCLDPVKEGSLSPAEKSLLILQSYDTVRRFRTQKVVTSSLETGRLIAGNEPGVGSGAAELREKLTGRQDWIWLIDQEQQVKDSMLLFEAARGAAERTVANGSA